MTAGGRPSGGQKEETGVETSEGLARGYAGSGGWQLSQEVDYEAGTGVSFELVR